MHASMQKKTHAVLLNGVAYGHSSVPHTLHTIVMNWHTHMPINATVDH